jgi:hypothetical protein
MTRGKVQPLSKDSYVRYDRKERNKNRKNS